jgi:hypothetical protein
MLQGFFMFDALTRIRCPPLQKSSCGYIKLSIIQGGGPWGGVVMKEFWGDLPFSSGG